MRYSLAALFLLLAACGGNDFDAGRYDVTGRWTGTAVATGASAADTARYEFDLELSQAEEDVSGSGQLRVRGQSIPVTVTGDFGFPSVNLTVSSSGFVPLTFGAVFRPDTTRRVVGKTAAGADSVALEVDQNEDVLTGTLNGSALESVPLVIVRDTL